MDKNDGKNKRKARYFGANNGEFKFVKLLSFSFYNDYHNLLLLWRAFTSVFVFIVYLKYAQKCREPILNFQLLKNSNLRNAFIVYYAVPGIFTELIYSIFLIYKRTWGSVQQNRAIYGAICIGGGNINVNWWTSLLTDRKKTIIYYWYYIT